jgi:hypothetical protein
MDIKKKLTQCLSMSIMFIFILFINNSSCVTILIMINYWKLYEDIRREGKEKKKKLFVNRNVKQCGAQVLVKG